MIDLSIIIPTLNSSENIDQRRNMGNALRECLTSLQETTPPGIKIVITSNGDDPKALPIETKPDSVERINIWGQGQCKAVNAAVATTNTEWILISNDDMIYPPGWFNKLTAFIPSETTVVSPMLIEPIQGAPTFRQYFCGGAGGDFNKKLFINYAINEHLDTGYRPGFNLPFLINRKLWDLVGGYDVNYDPWGSNSDSDLEYKLKLAGATMLQNMSCPVYHFSQTSGTFHPDHSSYWAKNWDYFKNKWGFERASSPEIWTTEFEIPFDKLKYRPKWAKLPDTTRGGGI